MIKFLYIVIGIFMLYSFLNFIKQISEKHYTKKNILIPFLILYTIIYIATINLIATEISTLISLIIIAVISKFFLLISNKDLIYYSIIQWSLAIILDITIMNIFNKVIIVNENNIMIYKTIGSLIIAIIFIFLSKSKKVINIINKIKKSIFKINNFIFILIFVILFYIGLASNCLKNINTNSVSTTILLISIFFLGGILFFIYQKTQILFLKENITLLTKNNEFYIDRIDEYRILKHNLIANLNGLKSVSNKTTTILINNLILKFQSTMKMPKDFKNLPSGINGIIFEKIYNIDSQDIKISINNYIKNNIIEVISAIDYSLFCEALSVGLDNSIEAAKESKEKIIYINIHDEKEKIILTIINTFSGIIDLDEIGNKNYTSKQKGHGLGLFSIFKFNAVKVSTYIKENKFFYQLKVNKKVIK